MLTDLRFAFRQLLKSPGFTLIAIFTLALGIAGSTAIFSVIDGVLLHALPYPDSDRIVTLAQMSRSTGESQEASSPANFLDWSTQNDAFSHMAAASGAPGDLSDGDQPERVRVTRTTASFFPLFGVGPLLGRTLLASDDKVGHDNVAVISAGLWKRRYGADKNIVGREMILDGEPRTIVGVMPPGYAPDNYGELWVPSPYDVPPNPLRVHEDVRTQRDSIYLDGWARLKPGVTLARARAEMDAIARRLEKQYPDSNKDTAIRVAPMHDDAVGSLRPLLFLLCAAVGALLFIGCANVANLLLARGAKRVHEISIRSALGASRGRIVRQLLTESILLALAGGSLGVILAAWAIPVLLSISPPRMSIFNSVRLNWEVVAFALSVSLGTGILFGLAPAISASSATPALALNQGTRGGTAAGGRGRAILITLEVALSLVLLIGAGLLTKSFARLANVDPGFKPDHLLIFGLGAPARLSPEEKIVFYHQTFGQLREVPGVKSVGAVSRLPLSGGNSSRSFKIAGESTEHEADICVATADYFQTMGIPLLRGRNFTAHDAKAAAPVAIVNEAFIRSVFPKADPVGKVITDFGPNQERLRIVGVVGNVHHNSLEGTPRGEIYQPLGQAMWPGFFVAAKTRSASSLSLLPAVQNAVWRVNKSVPLGNPRTMEDFLARSLLQRKFTMLLLAIFAGVALLLAAVGLYGVISYSVAQRTRELGIRLALGAQRRDLLALVVREGMTLVGLGVGLGLAAALALTRLLSNLLFGVSTTDPFTIAALAIALAFVALLACFIPARRASLVNPIEALRAE
ncbi:MAG: ABC transporter permease [Chthoniobacterales bacterium]